MLNFSSIKENNALYNIAKKWVDWWHNNYFYRQVTVVGTENIPKNKPVLIGPNHQNALMDALAILSTRKDTPVFLTRSDIFQSNFFGKFFVGLKMLPVYRIRDGKDKLAKNEEIFNICIDVLINNKTLVVFPEAQHTPYRSLLQLKKGLMRIAFAAAEKTDFNIDLNIIPTGIYYSNYYKYRSKLLVQYGEAIKIADYKDLYLENPQTAMFKLRNDMREKMIPLAIHIEHKDFYNQFENARELYDGFVGENLNKNLSKPQEKFQVDKKIIDVLDKEYQTNKSNFESLVNKQDYYFKNLRTNRFKDYLFEKPWSFVKLALMSLIGIILSPVYFVGLINFLIPLVFPEKLVNTIKDKQFRSSIRFVISLFLIPLWYIFGFFIIWIFVKTWWIKFIFILAQGILFVFWYDFMRIYKKTIGHWRFLFNTKSKIKLSQERNDLLNLFKDLFEKNK